MSSLPACQWGLWVIFGMFRLACVAWADTSTGLHLFQGSCNFLELSKHPLVAFSALFGAFALSHRAWGFWPAAHAAYAVLTSPCAGAAQHGLPRSLIKLDAQEPATENSLMLREIAEPVMAVKCGTCLLCTCTDHVQQHVYTVDNLSMCLDCLALRLSAASNGPGYSCLDSKALRYSATVAEALIRSRIVNRSVIFALAMVCCGQEQLI